MLQRCVLRVSSGRRLEMLLVTRVSVGSKLQPVPVNKHPLPTVVTAHRRPSCLERRSLAWVEANRRSVFKITH